VYIYIDVCLIWFESLLAVLTGFRNFSHSLQVNSRTVPRLGNDRFLPYPLQFIACHHRRVGRWRVLVTLIASWNQHKRNTYICSSRLFNIFCFLHFCLLNNNWNFIWPKLLNIQPVTTVVYIFHGAAVCRVVSFYTRQTKLDHPPTDQPLSCLFFKNIRARNFLWTEFWQKACFVTQLSSNAGVSVWWIVWVTTNRRAVGDMVMYYTSYYMFRPLLAIVGYI
jgi:hypothetical protein